jgi:hypothetical protein
MGGNSNSHLSKILDRDDPEMIMVETKTINNLLKTLSAPTYVKIDTEGAEIDILKTAGMLLQNPNVKFICELHPFAWEQFGVDFNEFIVNLQGYGRELRLLDNQKKISDLPFYGTVLF